ncbi:MAG: sugar-binding domain-containing protein, partial [Armatimonadota bacterium]
KAYVAMADAAANGDFARAAREAQRMMELRGELHAISPFYIWPNEERYDSGVWYWGIEDRRRYYESLADMTSGKTGSLVAMLPERAAFRTDPYDDGIAAKWYEPKFREAGWGRILTTKPFYVQGYEDSQGHPYIGHIWYRLRARVPASARGKRIMLYAPVVETEAWCWVNGQYVGHRPYKEAYVRPAQMEFDVTDAIRPGEENVIAIRVNTSLSLAAAADGLLSRAFLYSPTGS